MYKLKGSKEAYSKGFDAGRRYERGRTDEQHHRDLELKQTFHRNHATEESERGKRLRSSLSLVVYVWMSHDGLADWVGRGTTDRPRDHIRKSKWWTPEHLLLTMTCSSEWEAMELEGRWGSRYKPRHNKEGYRHSNG